MTLVSMNDMLEKAKKEQYAVGQFNLNSLLWARPVLEAADELKSPVILATSDSMVSYLGGFKTVVATMSALIDELGVTVPVALHLDHSLEVDRCKTAIEAGYTSVMIDGSRQPIEENIALTTAVTAYAHPRGISVEAEIGGVGGVEDGLVGTVKYADPDECVQLTAETNVDVLAAALGSVHGPYKGEPNLGFKEMEEISNLTHIPLALHGGSGLPEDQIKRSIQLGHAKINVNTECAQAWTDAVGKFLKDEENKDIYKPREILEEAEAAIKSVVKEKINLFGSAEKG